MLLLGMSQKLQTAMWFSPTYIYIIWALVSNNGGSVDEVKRRMALPKTAIDKLKKIWRDRNINKTTNPGWFEHWLFPYF